jgi:glycosyltransferase involved in cell wall biosynthesis
MQEKLPFKLDYFREVRRVRELVERIRPAFVHAHYASGYGTLGRLIGFRPYIVSVWGSDIYEFPLRSPVHRWLLKQNLAAADYLCSTSRDMARETRKYTQKPILITPFGVDCELFSPGSAPRSEEREFVIGTVRSLEESYGIDILLRAFRIFADRHPSADCKLVIVGGGTREEEYHQLAQRLGLGGRVRFTGQVAHERVPEYLRSFSVFAALSRSESFGVAVLEASACGIPVLVSNVGGLPEVVVDGRTGIIIPPNDEHAAAEAFDRLRNSTSLRKSLGAGGQAWVLDKFLWDNTARAMEDFYEQVISGGPSRREIGPVEHLASAGTWF